MRCFNPSIILTFCFLSNEFWQGSKTFDVCTSSTSSISSSLKSCNNNICSSNKINHKYDRNDYGFPNVTNTTADGTFDVSPFDRRMVPCLPAKLSTNKSKFF